MRPVQRYVERDGDRCLGRGDVARLDHGRVGAHERPHVGQQVGPVQHLGRERARRQVIRGDERQSAAYVCMIEDGSSDITYSRR